jgi:hypothetical protein
MYLPDARTDMAGDMTEGGRVGDGYVSKCLEMARQPGFSPTYRLVTSPEAGPGATVDTLEQGYPLL